MVSKKALIANYRYFQQKHPQTLLAPVIKSNAYGHGIVEAAKLIDSNIKPPYVCVDNLLEAQMLSQNKIKTPILVLGGSLLENYHFVKKIPYTVTVFDIPTLEMLNTHQPGIKVHIKVDTGMNRLGLKKEQLEPFIQVAKQMDNIEFEGIFTHLAQADQKEGDRFTTQQIAMFKEALAIFRHYGFLFKWRHIGNTAGLSRIKDPDFNLSRLGLGFYGYSPFVKTSRIGKLQREKLEPALTLTSKLVHIKKIEAGEQIGYNGTFIAPRTMTIGIIPLGYHDGIDHRLSNRGFVSIEGVFCAVLGKVCMNMTTIDLSDITNPFIGQKVSVVSPNQQAKNTVDALSRCSSISTHNFLAGLHENIPRIFV